MSLREAAFLMCFAALSGASGCSRTYDGSIVPAYEVASDRVAGIPYLTWKQTPLDAPNMRGLTVAPPPAEPEEAISGDVAAAEPSVRPRPRAVRRTARSRTAQPTSARTLQCRDEAPSTRLVRMVCE